MNTVILIGRLGKDPEQKTFDNGGKITTFSLATTERYKNKEGEKKEQTQWHNIVSRGPLSDVCMTLLQKGSHVSITGKIVYREYEKGGEKRRVTEIWTDAMELLAGGKKSEEKATREDSVPGQPEDDLPF